MGKLPGMGLSLGCQTGKFPDEFPPISQDVVSSVTVCTDQEQSQITGGEFIFAPEPQGLGCTGCRFSDDFHRWSNDLNAAIAKAGLGPVEKAATLIFNIGYGPWQSAAWFHMICAQGSRLSKTLSANSQLVLRYWPSILLDRGVHRSGRDDLVGESARKTYIYIYRERERLCRNWD